MAKITTEQMELLEDIVEAYWTPHEMGKDTFTIYTAGGMAGTTIGHRSFQPGPNMNEDNERRADPGDIEELANNFLINLDGIGRKGSFHPTAEGKAVVDEHRERTRVETADAQQSADGGSGIGWDATFPVLKAVVDLFPSADPGLGVPQGQINTRLEREQDDPDTGVKLEMLVDAGYITGMMETDQSPGPLMAKPSEKALKLLAGWPADETVAAERLLTSLERQIASADPEENVKLRAARDALGQLEPDAMARVMRKVMMGDGP
jgi:hypothetical protein